MPVYSPNSPHGWALPSSEVLSSVFHAQKDSNNLTINYNTLTTVSGYSTSVGLYNPGGAFNTTTGVYTAPYTGYYSLSGSGLIFDTEIKLIQVYSAIVVAGGVVGYGPVWGGPVNSYAGSGLALVSYVVKGQEVTFAMNQMTSDSTGAVITAANWTWFSGHLVTLSV